MVSNSTGMEGQTVAERDVVALNSEGAMDQYLQSIGLYRKPVAKDGSCLFRAVSEKIFLTQAKHLDVRNECIRYMKENSELFREFVPGSFEHHLFDLQSSKEWAGQVEITALSMLYKHDFIIYQEVNQPPQHVTANGFKEKIELCFSNGNHYDCIYPKSFKDNAAMVQSVLYGHLYDTVLPECENLDALKMKANSANELATGVKNDWVDVKSQNMKGKAENFADSSANSWEVKRSLDPVCYRNVALEVWEKSKQDQTHLDKMLATKLQFSIGEYCLLKMTDPKSPDEFMKVRIDNIIEESSTYYVWIPELKEYSYASLDCLRPLLDKPENKMQIAYNELPGYYRKSDELPKDQPGNFQYPKKRQKGSGNRNIREDENRGKRFDGRNEGKLDLKPEGPFPNRRENRQNRRNMQGGDRGKCDRGERLNDKRGKPNDKGNRKSDPQRVTSPTSPPSKIDNKNAASDKSVNVKKPSEQENVPSEETRSKAEYPSIKPQEKEKTAKQHESPAAFWHRMRDSSHKPVAHTSSKEEKIDNRNIAEKENLSNKDRSSRAQRDIETNRAKDVNNQSLSDTNPSDDKSAHEEAQSSNLESNFVEGKVQDNENRGKSEIIENQKSPVEMPKEKNISPLREEGVQEGDGLKTEPDLVDVMINTGQKHCKKASFDTNDNHSGLVEGVNKGNSEDWKLEDQQAFVETQGGNLSDAPPSAFTMEDSTKTNENNAPFYSPLDSKVSFPRSFEESTTSGDYVKGCPEDDNPIGSPITFMSSHSDISAGSDVINPISMDSSLEIAMSDAHSEVRPQMEYTNANLLKSDPRNEQKIRILTKDNKDHIAYFNSPNDSSSSFEQVESLSRERSPEPESKKAQGKKVSFGEVTEISQVNTEVSSFVPASSQMMTPEMTQTVNININGNGVADPSDHLYYDESGNFNASLGMPPHVMPLVMHSPLPHPNEQIHIPQGFAVDPEGKDLPTHLPTLRYFFNLGLQYFYMQPQTPTYINMAMPQMPAVQLQHQAMQAHIPSQVPAQRFASTVDHGASQFNPEQEEFIPVSSAPMHYEYVQQPLNQARPQYQQNQNNTSQYEQPPRMRRGRGRGSNLGTHLSISRGHNIYNQTQHQQKQPYRVGKRGGFNMNTGLTGPGQNQYPYH